MRRFVGLVLDYWYLVALAVGLVCLFFWVRGGGVHNLGDILARLGLERRVIEAKAEARRAVAEQGAEAAKAAVEVQYQSTLTQLSAAQFAEAQKLRDDPAALAAFLIRATR